MIRHKTVDSSRIVSSRQILSHQAQIKLKKAYGTACMQQRFLLRPAPYRIRTFQNPAEEAVECRRFMVYMSPEKSY